MLNITTDRFIQNLYADQFEVDFEVVPYTTIKYIFIHEI